MTPDDPIPVRQAFRAALALAIRQQDKVAMSVYRSTLAAIDNAEAIPLDGEQRAGAIELSERGLGSTEAPRRLLEEADMLEIVRLEALELRTIADSMAERTPDVARRLRHQAALLVAVLDAVRGAGGSPDGG